MNRLSELIHRAQAEVWSILPSALQQMLTSADDVHFTPEPAAITRPGPKAGRIASIPVMGSISRRGSFWSMFFGGSTVDGLTKMIRDTAADPSIATVIFNIDSPGGTIDGLPELAAEVRKLAETKHVVAIANSLMASAAYWIASQADEIVATPEANVGSIGVWMMHADYSAMLEQDGIKVTYIQAGKFKTEGNPYQPLTQDALDHFQALVDDSYNLFTADVAKGRGVSPAIVRGPQFGEGQVFTAKDAKANGLIDRIATFQDTVNRLAGSNLQAESFESNGRHATKRRRLNLAEKTFTED